MIKGGETFFFHQNHLGSVAAITKQVGEGVNTLSSLTEYMPFGLTRTGNAANYSNYGFTDQEADNETGLYNYNARLYDPAIEMFLTADTIVPDPANPQSLNRYSYCYNNPLAYVDPSGHWRIGFSFHFIIGGHFSYDSDSGFDVGAGVGLDIGASFGDNNWDANFGVGAYSDVGYNSAAHSIYASGTLNFGPAGISGTYYANHSNYQVGASVGAGGASGKVGYSSFDNGGWSAGGSLFGAGANYNFNSKSWNYSADGAMAEILAYDAAAVVIGQLSYLYTIPRDLYNTGASLANFDMGGFASNFKKTVQDILIPRYGLMGGAGWGVDKGTGKHTLGDRFTKMFLNDVDAGSYTHDLSELRGRHQFRWIRDQWTNMGSPRYAGPGGVAYKLLGTVGFGTIGMIQTAFGGY